MRVAKVDSESVDGEALVRRYLEDVFSRGNTGAAPKYLRGDAFIARVIELVGRWRRAFPDFNIVVEDVIAEGDRVVAVETLSGTHDGVFESRLGPVAPTGRKVQWSRISVRTLDRDRFVDGFFEEDEVGLLIQLGVLDPEASTSRGWHSPLSTERREQETRAETSAS
jgi:predicted ester cyclase